MSFNDSNLRVCKRPTSTVYTHTQQTPLGRAVGRKERTLGDMGSDYRTDGKDNRAATQLSKVHLLSNVRPLASRYTTDRV